MGAPAHDREVAPLTRVLAGVAAAGLLAGCSWGGGGGDADRPAPAADPAPVSRPHFTGVLDVTVRTGRIVYADAPCRSPGEGRVCDPENEREYLLLDAPASARLVEARMDLAGGGTSWTVTVTFARDSARALTRQRDLARRSGAVVLVLDGTDEVLLTVPVTRVEGRRVTYPLLDKPGAWALVDRIANR